MCSFSFKNKLFLVVLISIVFSCNNDDNSPENETLPEAGQLVSYEIKSEFSQNELLTLADFGGLSLAKPYIQNGITTYSVKYLTEDKNNDLIEASGVVSVPSTNSQNDLILLNRGTIIEHTAAPSVSPIPTYEFGAALDFIVMTPDLIGFGSSSTIPQYYYINDKTANSSYDLVKATSTLLEEINKDTSNDVFISGYSQGGYSSLTQLENIAGLPDNFEVKACLAAAGGYDLIYVMQEILKEETHTSPAFLALVIYSYYSYYNETSGLESYFHEDIAEQIPTILNGNLSTSEVNDILPDSLHLLFNSNFISEMKNGNSDNSMYQHLNNNSIGTINTNIPIFLYHSPNDEILPYSSSQNLFNELESQNLNVTFESIEGDSHADASIPALIHAFLEIKSLQSDL
ncbi:alpha/beta hydrolase family protein [Flammeovirga agarivorans]|uniref:Secretory lipase n=1 Tax=Flammeovirga agarivorans TaxID=2726742 RepID=A0A7X8SLQ6_9BACT|nr:lipase family protein [Flammeovirga agarivorans]NLR92468.1 hypothetical protein [Flammeovirga agarivorans]